MCSRVCSSSAFARGIQCNQHEQYTYACLWLLQWLLNEMMSQKCELDPLAFQLLADMYANQKQSHMVEDVLRRWVALGRKVGLCCASDVVQAPSWPCLTCLIHALWSCIHIKVIKMSHSQQFRRFGSKLWCFGSKLWPNSHWSIWWLLAYSCFVWVSVTCLAR